MSKHSITFEQFYEAVGQALHSWGHVEEGFRDLFTRLVACSITGAGLGTVHLDGMWVLGGVFYSSSNFRARLQLIGRIMARIVHDDALLAEWNAVNNRALELYKRRNVMAHGQVYGHPINGPAGISYSVFDEGNRRKMTYLQVCAQTGSFEKFHERITKLAVAANKHLALHPRPPATVLVSKAD